MQSHEEVITRIESWFADHDGDGEFSCHASDVPYSITGRWEGANRIVFSTKPTIAVSILDRMSTPCPVGILGRYGLPCEEDLVWIRRAIGNRGVAFLGDMDPVDLMVFIWLRGRFYPNEIAYLGVSDSLLANIDIRPLESLSLPLGQSERQAIDLVSDVLDVGMLVGPQCLELLKRHRKVEMEAIVTF